LCKLGHGGQAKVKLASLIQNCPIEEFVPQYFVLIITDNFVQALKVFFKPYLKK